MAGLQVSRLPTPKGPAATPPGHERGVAPEPELLTGVLVDVRGAALTVRCGARQVVAARAVSCLVEPIPGDEVLVCAQPGAAHVLAVLKRGSLGDATLSLPDPAGTLTIQAPSLRLQAASRLDLAAPEVAVTTRRLHVVTDVLTQVARLASVIGEALTIAVGRQSTIAHQLDVKAQNRNTTISGLDNERLGARVTQSELSTASAAIVTVHARDDIRLDAKRVTIG